MQLTFSIITIVLVLLHQLVTSKTVIQSSLTPRDRSSQKKIVQKINNNYSFNLSKRCDTPTIDVISSQTKKASFNAAAALKLTGLFVLWYGFNAGCKYFKSVLYFILLPLLF